MAFAHFLGVLNSSLCDGAAPRKFVLARIAYLLRDSDDKELPLRTQCTAEYIGWQCGMSERQAQRHIAALLADKVLTLDNPDDRGQRAPNIYALDMDLVKANARPRRKKGSRRFRRRATPEPQTPLDNTKFELDEPVCARFELEDIEE